MQRIHNFGAGPAALPVEVLEEAQRDLLALPGVGMSVLEISHRSGHFTKILDEATENLRRLLGLSAEQQVLFLAGGASLQFSMLPMNLVPREGAGEGRTADYVVTGTWSAKAAKEAEAQGAGRRAWDGKAEGYVRAPRQAELDLDPRAAFLHFTSNETIHGVQFAEAPDAPEGVPLICDASSDFLSRPIDASRYALIYAGAQKNAGPAGVTIVIVHQALLERSAPTLPPMLSYALQAKEKSLYNTPAVFAIYVVMLVSRWLLAQAGGLEGMARANEEKARLLYQAIDGSAGFYRPHAAADSRSRMNVPWRLPSEELEQRFLTEAKAAGFDGLKGHRSVGGIRASIYNAVPKASVAALVAFMEELRAKAA